jgi:hypothetical protein
MRASFEQTQIMRKRAREKKGESKNGEMHGAPI